MRHALRVCLLFCGLLGFGACSPSDPIAFLDGAWQSDRAQTLAELLDRGRFTGEQWELLNAPKLFGRTAHLYLSGKSLTVFEGRCGPVVARDVTETGTRHLSFRYFDGFSKKHETKTVLVEGNSLFVPMKAFGNRARDVFSRASLDKMRERYPCTAALFDTA
jgi:hypothetical protein